MVVCFITSTELSFVTERYLLQSAVFFWLCHLVQALCRVAVHQRSGSAVYAPTPAMLRPNGFIDEAGGDVLFEDDEPVVRVVRGEDFRLACVCGASLQVGGQALEVVRVQCAACQTEHRVRTVPADVGVDAALAGGDAEDDGKDSGRNRDRALDLSAFAHGWPHAALSACTKPVC